ncbi:MAG: hypothetical protein M1825_000214 [Sarcosagium campestre]|nr:MAG: hypothetical protein M1825_000214 [Sarcosagium campestre]
MSSVTQEPSVPSSASTADSSIVAVSAVPAVPAAVGPTAPPRKRRRRAPATGAAHDCFACRKKNMKCDRRRPYCSQCLEQGKDCSGYKTQLTWGVGVASRGKLRGLSTPVARKPDAPVEKVPKTSKTPALYDDAGETNGGARGQWDERPGSRSRPATSGSNITTYDFVNIDPTGSPTMSEMNSPVVSRPSPTFFEHMGGPRTAGESIYTHRRPRHNLLRLATPIVGQLDEYGMSTSASSVSGSVSGSISGSISGYSEGDMASPIDYPQTPEDVSYMFPPCPSYNTLPSQPAMSQSIHHGSHMTSRAPTSIPEQYILSSSISSNSSSEQSNYDFNESQHRLPAEPMAPGNLQDMMYENEMRGSHTPTTEDLELGFAYAADQRKNHNSMRQSIEADTPYSRYRMFQQTHYNPPASPFMFDI